MNIAPLIAATLAAALAQEAAPPAGQAETDAGDAHEDQEDEEIVVQGTRSRRRIQDEPIRVEVVTREEVEEKLLMRPGNIAMLVNEIGGIRVQVTSPALGAANIRIQGMEGRYTQLLADGLPLYGGQSPALGLLQIPPTDLGQVEVIKGAASALYGPSALGGVINLVSRRPGDHAQAEMLLNGTTRGGQDLTGYLAAPLGSGWSASVTGGAHRQDGDDLDGDFWLDIAAHRRWTIRPRLFWQGASGASLYATVGAMTEDRTGGTRPGRTVPDGSAFPQTQATDRLDAGLATEMPVGGAATLHLRASHSVQHHRHLYGDVREDDRHATSFAEASIAGRSDATTWVAGAALQRDVFRSETFPAFDFSYRAPALFGQVEHDLLPNLTLAASARVDFHSEYGTQFSPRLSALYKPGFWTIRASAGRGFYAPTPFVDEIEAAGLSRLEPLSGIEAETARNASLDIGYARGPFEGSVTVFASTIDGAARLETVSPTRVRLVNADGPTRIAGSELLLRYRQNGFTVTASYVFVDASEPGEGQGAPRRQVPLVPRHSAGLVAMWEEHGRGRIGLEIYRTGRQPLEDNPYRSVSRPYFHVGLLGEIVLGKVSLFANAENILNVRQTRYDPLLLPARAPDGRWTVDVWAPTEGVVLNGGLRLRFGGH